MQSSVFDQICVSSDDDEILGIAKGYDNVLAVKRPVELASDTAHFKDVCAYLLEDFAARGMDYAEFAVLLVTNPFFILPERSVDIDIPLNLAWAEFLLSRSDIPRK